MIIWARLVIEVAKEKDTLVQKYICYYFVSALYKASAEVFYYWSENLPLSQKLSLLSEGAVSYYGVNQLSITRSQISLYPENYFE